MREQSSRLNRQKQNVPMTITNLSNHCIDIIKLFTKCPNFNLTLNKDLLSGGYAEIQYLS